MQIIISPAKKINDMNDYPSLNSKPLFLDKAQVLYTYLQSLNYEELKKLYKASDKIVEDAERKLHTYNLDEPFLTAINAYDGIQYQYMHASLFDEEQMQFLNEHLYIISGLYGILRPLDEIIPYRLEMQSKINCQGNTNLYDYWGDSIAEVLNKLSEPIINLGSNEYSKSIKKYIPKSLWVDVYFYENENGELKEKGVYVKMARGAMVRYLVENRIDEVEGLKGFNDLNFTYSSELSTAQKYIFIRSE